jgi:hypothetical protein
VTAIEKAELDRFPHSPSPEAATMTEKEPSPPPPTPPAAATPPARKSGPAKGWKKTKAAAVGADAEADGRVAAKMISTRLTKAQTLEIERWRSQFFGLDLGAAVRVLLDIGLAARPREVVDPLGLLKSTFRRVRRPGKGSI